MTPKRLFLTGFICFTLAGMLSLWHSGVIDRLSSTSPPLDEQAERLHFAKHPGADLCIAYYPKVGGMRIIVSGIVPCSAVPRLTNDEDAVRMLRDMTFLRHPRAPDICLADTPSGNRLLTVPCGAVAHLIGEKGGLLFFKERRAGICFAHHEEVSGRCVSIVPCSDDVEGRLDRVYEVLGQSIWYYQDMRDGQCFALGPIHGNDFSFLVDCGKVAHLLGPPEGRWRSDKRLR